MPDTKQTEAEKNADSIRQEEQTEQAPRGNVYSEEEDAPSDGDAPPPLPN